MAANDDDDNALRFRNGLPAKKICLKSCPLAIIVYATIYLKNEVVPRYPNILQRNFSSSHQEISNHSIRILNATYVIFYAAVGFTFQKDGTYLLQMQEELPWPEDDLESL